MVIERLADAERVPCAAQVEMHDLPERMDAGIGAAGRLGHHPLAGEALDRLLEHLLHRKLALLPLPAAEGASVIFEGEAVARH